MTPRTRSASILSLVFLFLCSALAATAQPTLAELDARYDELVAAEGSLLADEERIEAMLGAPDAILIETPSGGIVAMSRSDLEEDIVGLVARLRILGADKLFLGSFDPQTRAIADVLMDDTLRAGWLLWFESQSHHLRQTLISGRAAIATQVEQVRAQGEVVQAERVRLRNALATGTAEADLLVTRCLDPDAPHDRLAGIYSLGGGARYRVIGNQICRGRTDWGHYRVDVIMEDEIWMYICQDSDPNRCERVADYAAPFERDVDSEGRERLWMLGSQNNAHTVFYPRE
jgi:hypothetical protein